jgi:hypothetical protein
LAAKHQARAEAKRQDEISAAIAPRRCNCGREIVRADAAVCDRCQKVIDGPPKRHHGDEGTA